METNTIKEMPYRVLGQWSAQDADTAEDFAKYCREQGYRNARIEDIYSNSGIKGGNVLRIDL